MEENKTKKGELKQSMDIRLMEADTREEELGNISKVELHQYKETKYAYHSNEHQDSGETTPEGLGTSLPGADDNAGHLLMGSIGAIQELHKFTVCLEKRISDMEAKETAQEDILLNALSKLEKEGTK